MDLSIKPIKSSKDSIKQPDLAEAGVIPKLGASVILCGRSGSGKTTLLNTLITDKRFYGKHASFKHIFLFSPSAEVDDLQRDLALPSVCVFTDLSTAPSAIEKIYHHQMNIIKKVGAAKADQICFVFDDCIGDSKFMKDKWVIKSFIASRHFCCTTFLCTQHWTRVERVNRLQASQLYFWSMSQSALELLADEFCPNGVTKKQFFKLVADTLEEPYAFLSINMKAPDAERYRVNLDRIINLDYYKKL